MPFSHEHHVRGLGIDCRYCHTSVEKSSFAGIPPTETCMTCHSQIWTDSPMLEPVRTSLRTNTPIRWNRVHDLPDYVYFNHGIHVQKGVGCVSCHGRVDQMPLTWKAEPMTMEWCLSCHRNPEKHLRPREEVFNMDWVPPEDQVDAGPEAGQGAPDPGRPARRLLDVPPMTMPTDTTTDATRPDGLDLTALRARLAGAGGPALLAEPRGAGGDAGVPGVPPPRVPRPGRGVGRRGRAAGRS